MCAGQTAWLTGLSPADAWERQPCGAGARVLLASEYPARTSKLHLSPGRNPPVPPRTGVVPTPALEAGPGGKRLLGEVGRRPDYKKPRTPTLLHLSASLHFSRLDVVVTGKKRVRKTSFPPSCPFPQTCSEAEVGSHSCSFVSSSPPPFLELYPGVWARQSLFSRDSMEFCGEAFAGLDWRG